MKEKITLVTDEIPCPKCGRPLSGHTSIQEGEQWMPNVGDVTICMWCATILEYKEGMTLKEFTVEELRRFAKEQPVEFVELIKMQTDIEKFIKERRKIN